MKTLFLVAIFVPLSILGGTRVPDHQVEGNCKWLDEQIDRGMKRFHKCLQERAEWAGNTSEEQCVAAERELRDLRLHVHAMLERLSQTAPEKVQNVRQRLEDARALYDEKRAYLRDKPKPAPAAPASFYDRYKTPIWFGGGIIVAALCYGVYQLFVDNEETPEEKMSLEEHHQKQQANRSAVED